MSAKVLNQPAGTNSPQWLGARRANPIIATTTGLTTDRLRPARVTSHDFPAVIGKSGSGGTERVNQAVNDQE